MPILNRSLQSLQLKGSSYGFSAARIENLEASEYTLAVIAADTSASVSSFLQEIEACVEAVTRACSRSPRAENLLLRVISFDGELKEIHGFRPIAASLQEGYKGRLELGGMTALHDAIANSIDSVKEYGDRLARHGFGVNGIVFVMTDGMDNASKESIKDLTRRLMVLRREMELESLITILVGVNLKDDQVKVALERLSQALAMQFIALESADERSLGALADFFSRSIALQSRALNSGGAALLSF